MKVRAKAKAKAKATPRAEEKAKLDELEWNFADACPETELEECKVYETARRTEFWPRVLSTLKEMEAPANFWCMMDLAWDRIFRLLCKFPEFPQTPWLLIGPEERSRRLRSLIDSRMSRTPIRELNALIPLFGRRVNFPGWGDDEEMVTGPLWPGGIEILSNYRPYDPSIRGGQYVFLIAWEHSNEQIQESFQAWLSKSRPNNCLIHTGRGKRDDRQDSRRAALRALGAWSLAKHNQSLTEKLSISQLLKHAAIRNEHGVRVPLYSERKSFSRAQDMAGKIITSLVPPQLAFHSMALANHVVLFREKEPAVIVKVRKRDGVVEFSQ